MSPSEPVQTFDYDDLAPAFCHVKYQKKKYVLREPTAGVVATVRNIRTRAMRGFDDNGRPLLLDGLSEAEPTAVAMCLFEISDKGIESPNHVPVNIVKSWLSEPVSKLYEWVQKTGKFDLPPTEDVLVKDLERAQKALADFRKKVEETSLKNEVGGTPPPSDSPTN